MGAIPATAGGKLAFCAAAAESKQGHRPRKAKGQQQDDG
jgi:hypothetical protein